MPPRRARVALIALGIALDLALALAPTASARAQSGIAKEGAVFLLVPVGARSVGRAQAVVADSQGAEGIWGNPASLARNVRREVAVDHAANAFITGDALGVVIPAGRAGVLAASLLYFNFGDQAATDEFGNTIGTLYSRALVFAANYSATFGRRVTAGVTHKYLQQTQSCSGACQGLLTFSISTSAFDLGTQVVVDDARRLTLGAAVRNAGFGLQTIDREQTDPLPTRLHAGAQYAVPTLGAQLPGASLLLSAEVVTTASVAEPAARVGAELRIADRIFVRGGLLGGSGDGSSGSVGFGFQQGTLGFEFARSFGGPSANAGTAPTYVALRAGFR